jgi:hypothetical protein
MAEIDPRFELARKRAKQASTAATAGTQQQSEAAKRRFAALGLGTSGAALKQEQQIMQQGAQRLSQAEEGIQAQEFAEQARKREIQEGRQFASEQSALGRRFQAEQAQLGREFQSSLAEEQRAFATGEREASEKFGAEQAQISRDIQQKQFQDTFALQQDAQKFSQTLAGQQMKLALDQFGIDKMVTFANLILQSHEAGFEGKILGQEVPEGGADVEHGEVPRLTGQGPKPVDAGTQISYNEEYAKLVGQGYGDEFVKRVLQKRYPKVPGPTA